MKNLILICSVLVFSGCATLGVAPPNFEDGTWSACTYSKPDGTSFTGPLQLGGLPLAFTKPDGTKVECIAIPKKDLGGESKV